MPTAPKGESLLGAADACFVQRAVSIILASRDVYLGPASSLACGCRVAWDRRLVAVILNADRASDMLANLADNSAIAVNLSQPSTHRSLQRKGQMSPMPYPCARMTKRSSRPVGRASWRTWP